MPKGGKNSLIVTILSLFLFVNCSNGQEKPAPSSKAVITHFDLIFPAQIEPVIKSDEEWKSELNEKAYYVLREKETERAFSGKYWKNKEKGFYCCAACGLPLFHSSTKFRSGTGWPSFYKPVVDLYIDEAIDKKFGMKRVEVLCQRCQGHLGHVFEDGPEPTGLRYCINSVSLSFVPSDKEP